VLYGLFLAPTKPTVLFKGEGTLFGALVQDKLALANMNSFNYKKTCSPHCSFSTENALETNL